MRLSDFYTPELADFITPWESTAVRDSSPQDASTHILFPVCVSGLMELPPLQTDSCSTAKSESLVPSASDGASVPEPGTTTSTTTSSQTAVCSHSAPATPQGGQTPVSLLMDQAEVVTQHGCSARSPDKGLTHTETLGITALRFFTNASLKEIFPAENVIMPDLCLPINQTTAAYWLLLCRLSSLSWSDVEPAAQRFCPGRLRGAGGPPSQRLPPRDAHALRPPPLIEGEDQSACSRVGGTPAHNSRTPPHFFL